MVVRIWGCRGSMPAPGAGTVRTGGNTSCVSVAWTFRGVGRVLVLDAGTGIRALGNALAGGREEIAILTTHPHVDHLSGFPFFAPLHQKGRRLLILSPAGHRDPDALLRQFDGVTFPLRREALAAELVQPTEDAADVLAEMGLSLQTMQTNHPGGCLAYRVAERAEDGSERGGGAGAVVYLTDNELRAKYGRAREDFVGFARGAGLLIHDAAYTAAELPTRTGWGHSAAEDVVDLAKDAGVRTLLLFHHDLDRTDDEVDAIERAAVERAGGVVKVMAAREGQEFALG
jgi:phosphoribosyl 1,2-cyclic phosphodiesterase